jgi:transposase
MAKRYRPVQRDQGFLLPPDMREWLPAGHPVHVIIEAVAHLDTSVLHAARKRGGAGRAGYDPDLLITLLIWAYANRVTSSRRIEGLCWTDVAFRLICAGDVPDHTVIARFRSRLGTGGAEALFAEVLGLCGRLGMGKLGVIAIDGMKIAGAASKSANRTEAGLRKLAGELAREHAANDAAEDQGHGPGRRGDEVPPEVADPATRAGRITAALAELQAEREAEQAAADKQAAEYLAAARPSGRPPAQAAVAAAAARLERARAARAAQIAEMNARADGPFRPGRRRRRPAAGVEDCARVRNARADLERTTARAAAARQQPAAAPGPAPVRNITDPDTRLMPTRSGFVQGWNAQNVTTADGLILATQLTASATDTPWYQPMIDAAVTAAARLASARPPGTAGDATIGLVLADAGYLSRDNLTAPGPDRLIATGKHRDLEKNARHATAADPGRDPGDPITAMTARLATPDGITAYRQRSHIAETPHGHIKHNLGIRQLTMRGTTRAAAEWTLICAARNLTKAITAGHLTTAALAT